MPEIENVRSWIQEWFSECSGCLDVAKLYYEIVRECDLQTEFMCEQLLKGETE